VTTSVIDRATRAGLNVGLGAVVSGLIARAHYVLAPGAVTAVLGNAVGTARRDRAAIVVAKTTRGAGVGTTVTGRYAVSVTETAIVPEGAVVRGVLTTLAKGDTGGGLGSIQALTQDADLAVAAIVFIGGLDRIVDHAVARGLLRHLLNGVSGGGVRDIVYGVWKRYHDRRRLLFLSVSASGYGRENREAQ